MRATNLMFRSPHDETPAPYYCKVNLVYKLNENRLLMMEKLMN